MMRVSHRAREPQSFRIYQANVNHSSPCHDIALSLAFDHHYDFVAIQEPWVHADLSQRRTKSHPSYQTFVPLSHWTSRPRVLLYARKGLSSSIFQSFSDLSRDLVDITIHDQHSNTRLQILNIYNAPRGSEEYGQGLQHLLSLSHTEHPTLCPAMVCGDFNIRHADWDTSTNSMPQDGDALLHWTQAHSLYLLNPLATATHNRGGTLDLVFAKHPGAKSEVSLDLHTGSDHETILTTLPQISPIPLEKGRLRYRSCDTDTLLNFLRPHHLSVSEDPELEATAIVSTLRDALMVSCPRAAGRSKNAPWWTRECGTAFHRYKSARRTGYANLERKHFHDTIKRSKRDFWRAEVANADTPKDIFKITSWHKSEPSYQSPPLRRPDGSLAKSPGEKTEVLHRTLLSRELDIADNPLGCPAVPQRKIAWPRFEVEEVFSATCGVSSTTPGSDEIPANIIRLAWPILGSRIVTLFQRCYDRGVHPSIFKQAQVVILPKSGRRDRASPSSYRPISLLSCLGKGLERVLARRISFLALRMHILGKDQCSAVSRRSAVDLTTALACDIQSAWDEKLVAGMITLDIKGAFDGIAQGRLVNRLREQGWPEQLLGWTASFFDDRTATIRLDGQLSQTFDLRCGLPQGSPVSPILFLLYVEPLLKLTRYRFGYADDVCLLAHGKTLDQVQQRLQQSLELSLQWGVENGITFEASKTELQYFHRKRRYVEPSIDLANHSIAANDCTKWLGVFFDRKLQFKEHLSKARIRARQVTDHLKQLCGTTFGASPVLLRQAVEACAFSTLLYGAETWYSKSTTQQAIGQLQVAMNRGARAVLPVYRTTPSAALIRESGWGTAEAWLNRLRNRYTVRVAAADPDHPLRRRWNTTRFRWIRQDIDVELTLPTSEPPWHIFDRDRLRQEVGAVGRQAGPGVFEHWLNNSTNPLDLTIYSDGSMDGDNSAGAGFIIFRGHGQDKELVHHGIIPLGQTAEVYDAEIVGAVEGLRAAVQSPWSPFQGNVKLILDNEEAAIRLHSGLSTTSASNDLSSFRHLRQTWMEGAFSGNRREVTVRWCPGHAAFEGNEAADGLAKAACQGPPPPNRKLTIARAKRLVKRLFEEQNVRFWEREAPQRYSDLGIKMTSRAPSELSLPRKHMARLLAARSGHGDFTAYHKRFQHDEYQPNCRCGRTKTPEHFLFCSLGRRRAPIQIPPLTSVSEQLRWILGTPEGAKQFAYWCDKTSFFHDIQQR